MSKRHLTAFGIFVVLLAALGAPPAVQAQISGEKRSRAQKMLKQLKKDLEKNYYDPGFGGLDLEAEYEKAKKRIEEVTHLSQAFGVIAQFMLKLEDSHTYFIPPIRVEQVDYGFDMLFVGDTCYVTRVDEGSWAEKAGLEPGHAVLAMGQHKVQRQSFLLVQYIYHTLAPQRELGLIVRAPDGESYPLDIRPEIVKLPEFFNKNQPFELYRYRELTRDLEEEKYHIYVEMHPKVMLWKMPSFEHYDRDVIDELIEKARKHEALILDLRDNPGGSVKSQLYLIGSLFREEVNVGQRREREHMRDLIAEPADNDGFEGELIVLVNSGSASSAEILARIVQLEGRGTVIGDRTAGAVMTSKLELHEVGFTRYWKYGASITVSEVIMPDGGRLEKTGVIPDEIILPTAEDLREGRDPVMKRALEIVGIERTPEQAARLFDID